MKKLILFFLAIGLFSAGFAKGKHHSPEERAEKRVNRMTETLELSTDQQTKMYSILVEKFTEMKSLRAEFGEDREGFKAERKTVAKKYKKEANQLLTPTQLEKKKELHKKRKEMRAKRKSMSVDEKAAARVQRLDEVVGLSPDQKTEITLLTKKRIVAMKDLKEASNGDPKSMKAERKVLKKDYKTNLKQILDKEQQKKLKEFKAEKRGQKHHKHAPRD